MNLLAFTSIPPLAVILITALFGLADVRPLTQSLRGMGQTFDIILGACFMLMGIGSTFLVLALLTGTHDIKWPGVTLLYGIAGVFFMIGHYAPWRKWVKRERL